ncbi:MAG TPA: MFS transporter [Streptosporangiaceae bacterium]|nr:MFS transporter [Streptosporangiaceae bacterium]
MPDLKILSALQSPQYRRIFAGQLVSQLGDWLDFVGLLTLVAYVWKGGPAGLAAVAVSQGLVYLIVGPFTGVLADRLHPRISLVGSDLARAGLVLCYLIAPNIPVLLSIMVVKVCFSSLFGPAEMAQIRKIVPEDKLLQASSLSEFVSQATKIGGPAVGGLLVALTSVYTTFVCDSVSYVASAAILMTLRFAAVDRTERERSSMRADALAGLRFIWTRPVLLLGIGSFSAAIFLVFMFDTFVPLALRALSFHPSFLGYAYAFSGLGTGIGVVLVGQWGERVPPLRLMSVSQALVGLLVAGLGAMILARLHNPVIGLFALVVVLGFCASGLLVAFPYLLMRQTPAEMIGRVSAFADFMPTGLQLAGPVVGAAIIAVAGVGWVYAIAGLGLAGLGVVVSLLRLSGTRPGADSEPDAAEPAAEPLAEPAEPVAVLPDANALLPDANN